jgi:predicted metal-binding membrane protein
MRAASGQRTFIAIAALCFIASAAVTVTWCGSMSSMPGMPMAGGWTMSMAWMRMPGQGWPGAAATFLCMWAVMMIAMMVPALVPMLIDYRESLRPAPPARVHGLTLRVAAGYFLVWTIIGAVAWPFGVAVAELAMRIPTVAHAVPLVAASVTVLAGAWQRSAWKSRQLACCRRTIDCCRLPAATPRAAWRQGFDLGVRCLRCCAPLTAMLFVSGVMELRAMVLVAAAITVERVASWGGRAARVSGAALVAVGLLGLCRALE